ncbi:mechanosensitive ion channel family protein [Pseudomonas sp. GOM6]|uniref:mechanosensitive ion channel family protein n=1 Tax=Pseudomonas sp. GOM6 TaxID=3036944 RepID=UPI0024096F67|nr:mechanosensitive ion channel family protein [Pseudomonas sp. GOM6]MDG1581526.1 mechanosensitive ion channel family protein [Pseudomonas sp. GOM6]
MPAQLQQALDWLNQHPQLHTVIALGFLLFIAWLANWLVKRILVRGLNRVMGATHLGRTTNISHSGMIKRLSNIVPALILISGVHLLPNLPDAVAVVVVNVASAFIVVTVALALSALLDIINTLYQLRPDAHMRPIKGYLQVVKIAIFAIATILVIASLIDRSPLILLSGLGAMAAVLLLIFQDTLLSLVASVQISSNDIIRVGDWVEMPQLNVDGDVIDIALHTVKVQNWDKTISTIPTKRFITDAFKNWRGMEESGGRRIKRCLYLDQNSVHFLDAEQLQELRGFALLADYLDEKQAELKASNAGHDDPRNTRRLTNLGTFRAYVERYLRQHPSVHQQMTLMTRQLQPGADGLPLEIYCFTNTTTWLVYEGIQADIFDHLLAILPAFGLRVFQSPSGADFRVLIDNRLAIAQQDRATPAAHQ